MTENLYSNCIRTYTGKYIDVFNPDPNMICIEDIAHALSHQCRFGGHMHHFYSVAQHSVLCAFKVDVPFKLQALMHDASEAYLMDIPRPIKKRLKEYIDLEENLMKIIADKFAFEWPMRDAVRHADELMLEIEWANLVIRKPKNFPCFPPSYAKDTFLKTFSILTKQHEPA